MREIIFSRAFAMSNGEEQANLINDLSRELFVRCGGMHRKDSYGGMEWQLCEISKFLNADGMKFIEELAGFVELRKKEM